VNLGYPVLLPAKDDGSGGDNWSYKTCTAPVKSSLPSSTNLHQTFYRPDANPVSQVEDNQQFQSTEWKIIVSE